MAHNAIIIHGGAPTAVLNASLYGTVRELMNSGELGTVYGAGGGMKGILSGNFINLSGLEKDTLEKLPYTPASAIGTSRDPIEPEAYAKIVEILNNSGIRYVFLNGGNGTMDTAGKICRTPGSEKLRVLGIPKTIDNDIAVTDHSPGYGSAARYIASVVREIVLDVQALPIHICIVEAMGRNAGWITAASSLAGDDSGSGPDLICVPEIPFDEDRFLEEASALYRQKGYAVVVVSEGLKKKDGSPIVAPIFTIGRSVYYGDTGTYLAGLIVKKLGIKSRSEKPGILGRVSSAYQSETDRSEAIAAGAEAARSALAGKSGVMVGFQRDAGEAYSCRMKLIPFEEVMAFEKVLPGEFISPDGKGVTKAFRHWCRPLIGSKLTEYVRLENRPGTRS